MRIGVVSDTHNNTNNIKKVVSLFNEFQVDLVVHTGDITNSKSLELFSDLKSRFVCVLGNNDRFEKGLFEVATINNFKIKIPPYVMEEVDRKIAIFHEPDEIESFLATSKNIDIIFHGHTHRFRQEKINGTLIFNPGESAGMMKGKNAIGIVDLINLSVERIFF